MAQRTHLLGFICRQKIDNVNYFLIGKYCDGESHLAHFSFFQYYNRLLDNPKKFFDKTISNSNRYMSFRKFIKCMGTPNSLEELAIKLDMIGI